MQGAILLVQETKIVMVLQIMPQGVFFYDRDVDV